MVLPDLAVVVDPVVTMEPTPVAVVVGMATERLVAQEAREE